jgi:transposase
MKPLLSDELWTLIQPLLPPPKPRRRKHPGRKPLEDRCALTGILYVLRTGIPWEYLPKEMGCGSGMTCWRKLRDWNDAGVWKRLHQVLLNKLQAQHKIDWSRAVIDSASVRAQMRGKKRDQAPWTAENTAPNTICLSTAKDEPLWPSRLPVPIVMTSPNSFRW